MPKFSPDEMTDDGISSHLNEQTRSLYLNDPESEMDESGKPTDDVFLHVVTQAISQHKQHVSGSLEKRWIDAYKNFQNQHFSDSKYHSAKFRGRSKHFRPKTRAAVRSHMAAAAAALFSSADVVQIKAQNAGNKQMRAHAAMKQQTLNYRLDRTSGKNGVPWFLESMGACQDAAIVGVCCSKQYWEYKEHTKVLGLEPVTDKLGNALSDENGNPVLREIKETKKLRDRPMLRVFPIEQVIRDPAAHWTNQAQESSFLCLVNPMTVQEVKAMGKAKKWREVDEKVLLAAGGKASEEQHAGALRRARDSGTNDRLQDNKSAVNDYSILWVHENFVRVEDEDWHFWSLGSHAILSEPVPVAEAYPEQGGERPVVIGYGSLEAHKVDPLSIVESWHSLQMEMNDLVNIQLDVMKQTASPIKVVRRASKISIKEVQNTSADSVIMAQDPEKDLAVHYPQGPSQQSYHSMDRLNADFDDLAGKFSGGSVATNRQLNETVGGMKMLTGAANGVQEFDLRVWCETWVEPVLRQLVNLCAYYENDPKILGLAAQRAATEEPMAAYADPYEALECDVLVSVSVGIGASDPLQKMEKLMAALQAVVAVGGPSVQARIAAKADELVAEFGGMAGYPDAAERFLGEAEEEDPRIVQLTQELASTQGELQDKQGEWKNKIDLQRMQIAGQLLLQQLKGQHEMQAMEQQHEMGIENDEFGHAREKEHKAIDHKNNKETKQIEHKQTGENRAAEHANKLQEEAFGQQHDKQMARLESAGQSVDRAMRAIPGPGGSDEMLAAILEAVNRPKVIRIQKTPQGMIAISGPAPDQGQQPRKALPAPQ